MVDRTWHTTLQQSNLADRTVVFSSTHFVICLSNKSAFPFFENWAICTLSEVLVLISCDTGLAAGLSWRHVRLSG
ncbi:MAG: hypothetical protein CMM01_25595 [Rhodopirellula sp.]|nr:hypothetical protein [Rhodopirellula sp.]